MVLVKWCTISVILALQFICYVESFRDTSKKNVTACTGRCSYTYSLQCPASQKIALHKLEYASKEVSLNCPNVQEPCQDKRQCCSYDAGDCRIPFSDSVAFPVYTKCSGKQQCDGLKAEQISTVSRCSSRDVSNYVAATYTCEDDDTFVDMCSNGTIYGKAINLILNGSQSTPHPGFRNSNLCACVISTSDCDSDARLRFQAVDVRLHKNQDITDCHPHSVIEITDGQRGSRPFSYKCQRNLFRRGLIDHYYTRAPYARISMYNKAELNISQIWLRISATFPDVDVMITCGSGAIHHSLQNVCVPPEFFPSTTPSNVQRSTFESRPSEDKGPNPGNIEKGTDVIPIVAGVVAGLVVVVLIIIVVCCRRRRRLRKKDEDRFSHSLTITAPPLPSPEDNVYDEYEAGNYYDSVENGRKYPTSPFKPATPGKNMGSFFPTEPKKVSPPVLPPPLPVVPPTVPAIPPTGPVVPLSPLVSSPTVPNSPASENSYDKDANPYQQPWDGKPLLMPNRRKKSDLAYATSDEIQVLIQRMDNERRKLNEGETTSPTGFIHIDDYKLSQSMREDDIDEIDEENDESEEDEGEDDSKKLLDHRHSVNIPDERHLPEHVHIDPHDVMCSSEDTGYRSVGSQEHILVSEDDYLVPGSVKGKKEETNLPQRLSSQSSVKGDKSNRSSVSEEKRNGETMSGEAYAEVYDALEEGKTLDVKTKF
ncbi:uncharacterized protein LOC143045390 [Mytilus galloprovincialis]|uniref:uncharacterized protein LOC143045390 n=1 Tax=Mytilus galloprovincialis TaxID=29158 RepID=UPI003F7C0695